VLAYCELTVGWRIAYIVIHQQKRHGVRTCDRRCTVLPVHAFPRWKRRMYRFVCFRFAVALFGPTRVRRLRLFAVHGLTCCCVLDGHDGFAFVSCGRFQVFGFCSLSGTVVFSPLAFVFVCRCGPCAGSYRSHVGSVFSEASRWKLCQSSSHMYKSYEFGKETINATLTTNSQSSSQLRRPNRQPKVLRCIRKSPTQRPRAKP
jgi:hypothetical protein